MNTNKKVLFIFGCQRSGTTATLNYFKTLKHVKTFKEHNDIIHFKNRHCNEKYILRLCNFEKLIGIINDQKEEMVVIKPLVESQRAKHILESIPNSVGIWMYRNPKDVVASIITKWGGRIGSEFIDAIVENVKGNWRSEYVDNQLTNFLVQLKKQCGFLTIHDKAAIFWYIRNTFFFSQQLHNNPKISKVSYFYLVNRKPYLLNKLFKLGFDIKIREIDFFNKKSIGKGKNIILHPLVNQLCYDLFKRLNDSWD